MARTPSLASISNPSPARATRWMLGIAAIATLAIVGASVESLRWLHYACKPLATLLILGFAWRNGTPSRYRSAVIVGLLLSTVGDIALMLPVDAFVVGLAAFLLAHIAYLVAFTARARLFARAWPFVAYASIAAGVLAVLWPHLPAALRVPVMAYVAVLASMAAQAAAVWRVRGHRAGMLAAIGGAVFVVSDAVLAIDRFAAPFAHAQVAVLATYWIAQTFIAASTRAHETRTP